MSPVTADDIHAIGLMFGIIGLALVIVLIAIANLLREIRESLDTRNAILRDMERKQK